LKTVFSTWESENRATVHAIFVHSRKMGNRTTAKQQHDGKQNENL
jgi:hypothetical protein